jgi:protocatechuate 3,4-dioxygenase beta subunit
VTTMIGTLLVRRSLVLLLIVSLGASASALPSAHAQDAPLPVYEVNGKVQNERGESLQGAAVQLQRKSTGVPVANATSGADGTYRFSTVAAGEYLVSAVHACCHRVSADVRPGGSQLTHTAPTLHLPAKQQPQGEPVRLQGIIKDAKSSSGVPNVFVSIQSYFGDHCMDDACSRGAQYFQFETDSAGRFDVEINRGHAYLTASREGYDTTSGGFAADGDRSIQVPLRPAEDRTVRLWGKLQSTAGGAPANAWVYASHDYGCPPNADCAAPMPASEPVGDGSWHFQSANPQWSSAEVQPDGSWELRIAEGRIRVTAHAPDHLEAHRTLQATAGEDREIPLTLEKLPPDSVTIRGRILDKSTNQPISGASVSVENQRWGTHTWAQTDAEGRYEVRAKPGYLILSFRADPIWGCAEPMTAGEDGSAKSVAPCSPPTRDTEYLPAVLSLNAAADETLQRDAKLMPRPKPQSEFKGYVLNASNNQPIASAVVTFYNELTRDWGSATTDEHGSYKIRVHAGYYSIRVWAEGYFDGVANAEVGDKKSERLDLVLQPGQKRYGYWAHGAYSVAEQSAGGPGASGPTSSDGPPMPVEGQRAYEGAGGGLGPYRPASGASGNASAPAGLVVLAAWGLLALLRRRT